MKWERRRLPEGKVRHVDLLHRAVPVVRTAEGLRAVSKVKPVSPESVRRYLEAKFGDDLPAVEAAMRTRARRFSPQDLAQRAYGLYEAFRPEVPAGTRGWGAMGVLDLARIRSAGRVVEGPG